MDKNAEFSVSFLMCLYNYSNMDIKKGLSHLRCCSTLKRVSMNMGKVVYFERNMVCLVLILSDVPMSTNLPLKIVPNKCVYSCLG